MNAFQNGTGSAVACSAVSCITAFDLHNFLVLVGQCIGIISGILSIIWVGYQFVHRKKP